MPDALEKKVAIVTGASRGIGAARAHLFAQEGARVVLASRNEAELSKVAEEVNRQWGQYEALAVPTDVSDENQVKHLFGIAKANFGPLDILVNNAGVVEVRDFVAMDLATWEKVISTNLRGSFLCSREAFCQMIAPEKA